VIAVADIEAAAANLETAGAREVLRWGIESFGSRLAIATSFQAEGMVIVDIAAELAPEVRVFTLDTGRLPAETYQMMEEVHRRYGIRVETVFPDSAEVESMTSRHGANLFYESVANRALCCRVRKVRPLERKLGTLDAWASGLRRGQQQSRGRARKVEIDAGHGSIVKLNPLADWPAQQVEDYIRERQVPRHPLYAAGYTSIGCQPCTRPTRPGEDPRAGRWWWEQQAAKECGIHFSPEGNVERQADVLLEELLD